MYLLSVVPLLMVIPIFFVFNLINIYSITGVNKAPLNRTLQSLYDFKCLLMVIQGYLRSK